MGDHYMAGICDPPRAAPINAIAEAVAEPQYHPIVAIAKKQFRELEDTIDAHLREKDRICTRITLEFVGKNPVLNKIISICKKGILPATKATEIPGASVELSNDPKPNDYVALNYVLSEDGILDSLFDLAKGGLVVRSEERVGEGKSIDKALKRNKADIIANKKEIYKAMMEVGGKAEKPVPKELCQRVSMSQARSNMLSADHLFLEALSNTLHHSAIFIILDTEPISKSGKTQLGCDESHVQKVDPEKLMTYVITSERMRANMLDIPEEFIRYVPEIEKPFTCIIKSVNEIKITTLKIAIKSVSMSDYESALLRTCGESRKPFFTHMTRLPIAEEEKSEPG
jgi:hypothetical protein